MLQDNLNRARDFLHKRNFTEARLLLNELHGSHPENLQVLAMLAMANTRLGNIDESITCYKRIISLKPDAVNAYDSLATAYLRSGQLGLAKEYLSRALALQPDHVGALMHTGSLYRKQNRLEEAKKCFLRALSLDERNPEILKQVGDMFRLLNKPNEAIKYYQRSVTVNPGFVQAHFALGQLYSSCGKTSQAKDAYKSAIKHNPGHLPSISSLGGLLLEQGDHMAAMELFKRALKINPAAIGARTFLLSCLNYYSTDRELIFKEHIEWGHIHTPLLSNTAGHENLPDNDRQLRIGYVSPDFREHSVSFFIAPLLANHDRSKFLIYAYSNVEKPDAATTRLSGLVDTWRPVFGMPDSQLADLIRTDQIDILVDLAGHTAQNRLLVFGLKPAPVQVTYLGYPNTTGIPAIDYRISDNVADPPGLSDDYHTERLARLPGGFLCYEPPAQSPAVMNLPAIDKGYITFGSFNNLAKVTPEVIETWSLILKAMPRSRLLIKRSSDTQTQDRYIELFRKAGVMRHQLDFIGFVPGIMQHLDLYNRIDIALDTFPYNGTTTTCESIWMGVPVVALAGSMHAGRVSMSILAQLGLNEFVATSPRDYVRIATKWAANMEELANLRKNLRKRVQDSRLCNGKAFTREIEKLYRMMWNTWCASRTG